MLANHTIHSIKHAMKHFQKLRLVLLAPGRLKRRMQTRYRVGAVLGHQNRFIVGGGPAAQVGFEHGFGGSQVPLVRVPPVVLVEAEHVEEVGYELCVDARETHVGEAEGPRGVEGPRELDQGLEVLARAVLAGGRLVGNTPCDYRGVVFVSLDEFADGLGVRVLRFGADGCGREGGCCFPACHTGNDIEV